MRLDTGQIIIRSRKVGRVTSPHVNFNFIIDTLSLSAIDKQHQAVKHYTAYFQCIDYEMNNAMIPYWEWKRTEHFQNYINENMGNQ